MVTILITLLREHLTLRINTHEPPSGTLQSGKAGALVTAALHSWQADDTPNNRVSHGQTTETCGPGGVV